MKKQSIFSKFNTLVISLIALAALSVGVGLSIIGREAFLRTIRYDYRMVGAQAGRNISLYLGSALQEINAAADLLSAVRLDPWRYQMALTELHRNLPHFRKLKLISPNEVEKSDNPDLGPAQSKITVKRALGGRVTASSVTLENGLPVIYMAAPVMYDGSPSAILWGELDLKPVWDLVIQIKKDLNLGYDGHVYLTDKTGRLVASDLISKRFGQRFHLPSPSDPPAAPAAYEEDAGFDSEEFHATANRLKTRELLPDFWISRNDESKMINLRAEVNPLGWTFYLTQPYKEAFQFLYDGISTSVALMSAIILVGIFLTWISTRRVLAPMARLHQGVSRAAKGDFSEPIHVSSQDEVGELADHFNEMQASLHEYVQRLVAAMTDLTHANCLAVLGTTSSQINHQIGNFLNYLMVTFSILKADELSEDSRNSLQIIEEQTIEIKSFMERLGRFANKADLKLEKWDAVVELRKIMDSCESRAYSLGIILTLDTELVKPVLADKILLQQAVLNLIENSFEAVGPDGRVEVSAGMDGERIRIQVRDNGRGVPPDDLEAIFTPFFSTKKGKGVGLGLALVQNVIKAHGGEFIIDSNVGEGTTITFWLPQAPPALPAA